MKQEIYNTYKISVDGNNGKFVITSIQNQDDEKLDSQNENKQFKSQDEAIAAAKEEIDKKGKNKKQDETVETEVETDETITQSSISEFDKLFNNILMEYKLQQDWKRVIKEDSFGIEIDNTEDEQLPQDAGYEDNPELSMEEQIENKEELTADNVIQNIKNAQNKQEEINIIKDVKENHSDILNDVTEILEKLINQPAKEMTSKKAEEIQELIEYSKK